MRALLAACLLATVLAGCTASSALREPQATPAACFATFTETRDVTLDVGSHSLPLGYDRTVQGAKETFWFTDTAPASKLRHVTATAHWTSLSQEPFPLRVTVAPGSDDRPYHSQWFSEGPSPLTATGFAAGERPKDGSFQVTLAPAWESAVPQWILPHPMEVALVVEETRLLPC